MVNLEVFITMYRSSSSAFMMNSMPSGTKKHRKVQKQKIARQPKCFFLSLLFFFFFTYLVSLLFADLFYRYIVNVF